MKVKSFLLLVGLICSSALFWGTACAEGNHSSSVPSSESSMDSSGDNTENKEPLSVPSLSLAADYSISWEEVEDASAYVINVNGEDLPIKTTICYLSPFTEVGDYSIKVKALRGVEETEYSAAVEYSVYSVEFPSTEAYQIVGVSTVYGGENYSFEIIETDNAYDFSNMKVYANGKRVSLNNNVGVLEKVSQNVVLTVEGVEPLATYQVSKSQGEGYVVVGDDYAVAGKQYSFQVVLRDGFESSMSTVKVNGSTLQSVDGVYTVKRVTGNLNIAVSGITFTGTIIQEFLLQRTWEENVSVSSQGYVEVNGNTLTVPVNWLKKLIGDGYTHLTFSANASGDGVEQISAYSGETLLRVASVAEARNQYVFRIDLANVKDFAFTLKINASANATLSMGKVNAYKYTEAWHKTSNLAYVCEEDGVIVVDTHNCGENVEVYKRNDVKVLGGINAVLLDEDSQPIYFNVASPSKVISTDMEYYASVAVDETQRQISVTVLKDEGEKRPILSFEQSKAYVRAGSPFVNISISSQEKISIDYVYGDLLVVSENKSIYQKAQFACELVAESYKENPFKLYSKAADIGTVIKLNFAENSLENEFYTEKAWSNINGGKKVLEDGKLSITDSWQINLSGSWLKKLYNAGYRTLEFDVKLLNLQYFQQYDTSAPTEGYFPADGNGIVHVTVEISGTEIVFRCKTQDGTDYNDQEAIGAFSVLIYNVEIN